MKNKSSEPKKHHFLPQFYLRNFQNKILQRNRRNKEIIVVYEKNKGARSFISTIEETGCKRDYHTVDYENTDKDRLTFESNLSKVETIQAKLVNKIIRNESIEYNNVDVLTFFIYLMYCRVPATKDFIEKSLKTSVKDTFRIMQNTNQLPPPPPQIKKFMQNDKNWLKVKISNWILLHYMFKMATTPEVLDIISKMNFTVLKAPKNIKFITSDTPVALYQHNYKGPYGVGFAHIDIEITLPISSEFCLFCSWDKAPSSKKMFQKIKF